MLEAQDQVGSITNVPHQGDVTTQRGDSTPTTPTKRRLSGISDTLAQVMSPRGLHHSDDHIGHVDDGSEHKDDTTGLEIAVSQAAKKGRLLSLIHISEPTRPY